MIQISKTIYSLLSLIDQCQVHNNSRFKSFCDDCNEDLCKDCIVDDKHKGHKIESDFPKARAKWYKTQIERDHTNYDAIYRLARVVTISEEVDVSFNGTKEKVNREKLCLKTLELKPDHAGAYNALATVTNSTGKLINGKTMNKRQLYIKSIELDPKYSQPYRNLGLVINAQDIINLNDGRNFTKRDFLIHSIALNPWYCDTWYNLALTMNDKEYVEFLDGSKWNKLQLYIKTLELDPNYSIIHYLFSSLCHSGSTKKMNRFIKPAKNINSNDKELSFEDEINPNPSTEVQQLTLDQEIQEYYSNKNNLMFFGKTLTFNEVLKRYFINNDIHDSSTIDFLPSEEFKSIAMVKSMERFLMDFYNKVYQEIDKEGQVSTMINAINTIIIVFQKIKYSDSQSDLLNVFVLVIKTFSHLLIGQQPITEYFYETAIKSLIKPKIPSRLRTTAYLLLADASIYCLSVFLDHFWHLDSSKDNFILEVLSKVNANIKFSDPNNISKIKEELFSYLKSSNSAESSGEKKLILMLSYANISPKKDFDSICNILYNESKYRPSSYHYILFKELGDIFDQDDRIKYLKLRNLTFTSAKECYINAIKANKYAPEPYYCLGKLLNHENNETIQLPDNISGSNKKYDRFELYRLSIQLGNRDPSIFYHLAMLIGQNSNRKVKLPILDEDSKNHYYSYFDLICQAIYHDPMNFVLSTYRYYLALIKYFLIK